ncbi:hypothetical protein L0128_11195, partial [candidate division KSB1 bacterium]|nr:hypothetical protein [candidate division KSB1 bacterium]
FTLLDFRVSFSNDFFDVVNYMRNNSANFRKLNEEYQPKLTAQQTDELIDYLRREAAALDNIWYRANIVPSFGLNIDKFAFSIYNTADIALRSDIGIVVPKIYLKGFNDVVTTLGYGTDFDSPLSLGVNLKLIRRFETQLYKIQVEEINSLKDTWKEGIDQLKQGKWGYGMDVGALFQLTPALKLGAVCQDLLGQVDQINTPMNLRLGCHYQPLPALDLAVEIEDFFNRNGEHFFNKFHLGAEYRIPVLRFRLGVNQGYPTAGIGLDLRFVQLNYTYFEYETAKSPGLKSEGTHLMDFRINLY